MLPLLAEIAGKGVTLTVVVAVVLQPVRVFVPSTVYTVVAAGLTTTLVAVGPVLQVKTSVPEAVSVREPPAHIELLGLMLITGSGLTVTVTLARVLLVQPAVLVPATE